MSNHTVSHRLLDELNLQDIGCEITASKKKIEQLTGKPCCGLAYPGGVLISDVIETARKCGVEYAVTPRFSNNSHVSDLLTLDRKDVGYLFIDNKVYPSYFKAVMSSAMDWLHWIYLVILGSLQSCLYLYGGYTDFRNRIHSPNVNVYVLKKGQRKT